MSQLAIKVKALQDLMIKEDYYLNRWKSVLAIQGWTMHDITNLTIAPNLLQNILFEFWVALPDSPAIHGPVFYKLCDLMEFEE